MVADKIKKLNSVKVAKFRFLQFAGATTLHGWRYLAEKPVKWFDVVFW
jgi:hypothetical protein